MPKAAPFATDEDKLLQIQRRYWEAQAELVRRLSAGGKQEPVIAPEPSDRRFKAPEWAEQPFFDYLRQSYLLYARYVMELADASKLEGQARAKHLFFTRRYLEAISPANFAATNPEVMKLVASTGGESLARGLRNMVADAAKARIALADDTAFEVGKNLAVTPGAVVFRNRLLEVIHYAPAAAQVHPVPIVLVTPCINKFYVLDLQPKKSLIKYLLDRGFDVYITSWKNPGAEMRNTSFEEYITDGVGEAVRVACELSGSEKVHACGYCIGGTLLTAYMAWKSKQLPREEVPVAHWTLLCTLVDFQSPGDIEVFIDEASIAWLIDSMRARGYLDGSDMATTFRLLRSNSLIWHYMVHGWLYGEPLPPSDVLYWNMDCTRMASRMHEFYLRELYLNNNLIKPNALNIAGVPLELSSIHVPLYQVSAADDHITPWRQTFRINGYVTGEKRFVLSSSGHILGIVNPPVNPPKRSFHAGRAHRGQAADAWLEGAHRHEGSWWEDWIAWLAPRCGEPRTPPPLAAGDYAKLADAPGTYVLER